MINLIKNQKVKLITLILASVFCTLGVANAITAGNVETIIEEGITGAAYTGDGWGNVDVGENSEWDASTTEDWGAHAEGFYTNRQELDFGGLQKYINTSDETITVLEVNAGVDAGAKLGCDGLDLGLEALFEFDLGEILDYLPRYIVTNLAVEALAQIYATPLISTVMDGLKSMRNFVAEMKQATCSDNAIQTRAKEIRQEAEALCTEEAAQYGKTDGQDKNKSYTNKCKDPGKIEAAVLRIKEMAKNKLPLPDSISQILDAGSIYGAMGTSDAKFRIPGTYRTISADRLIKSFIPNVSWDGDRSEADVEAPSELEPDDIYNKAKITVNNLYIRIYQSLIDSMKEKGYSEEADQRAILKMIQKYQRNIEHYGPKVVYENESVTQHGITRDNISKLFEKKDEVAERYKATHKIIVTKRYPDGFIIGPETGPQNQFNSDNTALTLGTHSDTDSFLEKDASEVINARDILDYSGLCWIMVPKDGRKDSGKYSWRNLYGNNIDVFNYIIDPDGSNNEDYNKIIKRVSTCKALASMDFVKAHEYMNDNTDLGESYLKYKTADVAYMVTKAVVSFVQSKLDKSISNSNDMLVKKCKSAGLDEMPQTAVYEDGTNSYKSCKDYADQNELPVGKQEALRSTIRSMGRSLELLKLERNSALEAFTQQQYNTLKM